MTHPAGGERHEAVAYATHYEMEEAFRSAVRAAINTGARRVYDVGGGAKPALARDKIEARGLDYVVVDVSADELAKAGQEYVRVQADAQDASAMAALARDRGAADLVITCWTAEHIRDPEAFHRNIHGLLAPGGHAVHLFPTLYALPFTVNRVLDARRSAALMYRVLPGREVKFPAYYAWCRGPSARQLARLRSLGYDIESYTGFFGHSFYGRIGPLNRAIQGLSRGLVRHPVPALTSFALVVLQRPS
jgi:SAM-dependent methyltransferase